MRLYVLKNLFDLFAASTSLKIKNRPTVDIMGILVKKAWTILSPPKKLDKNRRPPPFLTIYMKDAVCDLDL